MTEKSQARIEFSPETVEKYLNSPHHCPYCGSENITVYDYDEVNEVSCDNCDMRWGETYKITGIEPL